MTEKKEQFEKTSTGVVIFPEVWETLPARFANAQRRVFEGIQKGYHKQMDEGFFPSDLGVDDIKREIEKDPSLASNNTIIKRKIKGGEEKLVAISYRRATYRSIYQEIVAGLEEIEKFGWKANDELMIHEAGILKEGFETGNTDRAMLRFILLKQHPINSTWAGLLDWYVNPWKLSFQGLGQRQNPRLSADFSAWSRDILRAEKRVGLKGEPIYVDFMLGDSTAQAGYAAEKIWQGQTFPSQSYIAENVGYFIEFNDNVSQWKSDTLVRPLFDSILPPYLKRRDDLDKVFTRARRAIVSAHEIGHAAHVIRFGAQKRLIDMYQNLREAFADTFAPYAVLNYPRPDIISQDEVELAIYFDIARKLVKSSEYQGKVLKGDVSEKQISDPYPFSSAAWLNTMIEAGVLNRSSDDIYYLANLNEVEKVNRAYQKDLQALTDEGSRNQVEDFILRRASYPVNFLAKVA
ncbi:MAG: hypothetical protein M1142_01230 [Patescibacteria group bacterium]|nr:hypothetical protein [Patescibacteria group bacterium]